MARTPVFSPYVVIAGPPRRPAMKRATPSPSKVKCKPGSSKKFFPTTAPFVVMSPRCSINVTIEIGQIIAMLFQSQFKPL